MSSLTLLSRILGNSNIYLFKKFIYFLYFRIVEPSVHFSRDSLISRLRPLVVELLSSAEPSSLTLEQKVERLRETLMEESPEIIRKIKKFFLH